MLNSKKIKTTILIALLAIGGVVLPFYSLAEDKAISPFTIRAVLPHNQLDVSVSYFDIALLDNQTQTIYVELTNHSSRAFEVRTELRRASTNEAGNIDFYGNNQQANGLQLDILELLSFESVVTVPAHGSYHLPIEIAAVEGFTGTLAGGLSFTVEQSESSIASLAEYVSFRVAVILHAEGEEEVQPNFAIAGVLVNEGMGFGQIIVDLANTVAIFAMDVELTTRITNLASGAEIFYYSESGLEMAPNSQMELIYDFEPELLASGLYVIDLELTFNETTWQLSDTFHIIGMAGVDEVVNNEEAIADDYQTSETDNNSRVINFRLLWTVIIVIAVVLCLSGVTFLLLYRRNQRDDEIIRLRRNLLIKLMAQKNK